MAKIGKQKKSSGKGGESAAILVTVVSCLVVIVIVLSVIIITRLPKKEDEQREDITKRNVVVNQSNVEQVVDSMAVAEYVEPGHYTATMTNIWHFATGDAVSEDAFVENKEENTNDVYFDLFLTSDEEHPILQSPVIPRGAKMENIALDTPLEAGSHDCVMVYHLVDEDQNTISTLRVAVKVIVEQ